MARKPKYERPLTPEEQVLKAVRDSNVRHEREVKRQRKRHRGFRMGVWGMFPDWARKVIKIAIFIAVVLILDGVRRESQEFSAKIYSYSGQVQVQKNEEPGWEPVSSDTALLDGDSVTTGQSSYAIIVFSDGSAVQMEPNTQFVVRILDFARGGQRDRSFMVNYGTITARISSFFGVNSLATVCSPTAIAAARGTGFKVSYDPNSRQTKLQVHNGVVDFQSGYSVVRSGGGQEVDSVYYEMSRLRTAPGAVMGYVGGQLNSMSIYEKEPGTLQDTEYRLNEFCDPLLQLIGLAPGGWGYNSIDFARRGACMEALRKLQSSMEAVGIQGIPVYLNRVTLAELQLSQKETKAILGTFSDMMLQSYLKTGQDRYTIYVRARDKNKTLYELSTEGITELKGQ